MPEPGADPAPRVHPRARWWRDRLGLVELPLESGWWTPLSTSALPVRAGDAELPAHSSIWYLLDGERPVNHWHRLDSDDVHVLVEGGPVEYFVVTGSVVTRHVLGSGAADEQPVVVAPAGSSKALRLLDPDGFALVASVVTPAWAPDRVRVEPPAAAGLTWPAGYGPDLLGDLAEPEPG